MGFLWWLCYWQLSTSFALVARARTQFFQRRIVSSFSDAKRYNFYLFSPYLDMHTFFAQLSKYNHVLRTMKNLREAFICHCILLMLTTFQKPLSCINSLNNTLLDIAFTVFYTCSLVLTDIPKEPSLVLVHQEACF